MALASVAWVESSLFHQRKKEEEDEPLEAAREFKDIRLLGNNSFLNLNNRYKNTSCSNFVQDVPQDHYKELYKHTYIA